MQIGNVAVKNNIFLAPMAGVTDLPFRSICRNYGCGFSYTEMVSSRALHYHDKKTLSLMETGKDEKPCAIQIFGCEPEIMSEAALIAAEAGADIIDINMGCPTPKIVNNGDGSALMKNPRLAGDIMRAVTEKSPVPVTVKIRKGWNDENAAEVAKILEDAGAAAIAVHGRTREQFYSGEADWETIRRVKEAVKIPVIGNGDIFKAQDALNMINKTGCDAVMVGRGAQGNPFIFRQINELLQDGSVSYAPSHRERIVQALEHVRMLVKYKGENRGIMEARKHMAWYLKGIPNSSAIKNEIFRLTTLEKTEQVLGDFIKAL